MRVVDKQEEMAEEMLSTNALRSPGKGRRGAFGFGRRKEAAPSGKQSKSAERPGSAVQVDKDCDKKSSQTQVNCNDTEVTISTMPAATPKHQ